MSGNATGTQSWELKFDVGNDPMTGKRRIRYASFKGAKRDAELELARLVAQNAAGEGVDPTKATVAEFIERWDMDWASINVGAKTLERYRQIIKLNVAPHIGAVRLQKLRPVHLSELYAKLQHSEAIKDGLWRHGRSGTSTGSCIAPLAMLRPGALSPERCALVNPPQVDEAEITVLTEDQIGATLPPLGRPDLATHRFVPAPPVPTRRSVGACVGRTLIRLRPLCRIERSLEQTKAGLRFKSPKTGTADAMSQFRLGYWPSFEVHRARQQERRLSLGMGRAPDDSLVFARGMAATRAPHWLTQKFALAMGP